MRNPNMITTGLAIAAGALGSGVAAESVGAQAVNNPVAEAASAGLNGFGPKYSHDLGVANKQLDHRLEVEGPDSCTARAVAELAGIHTSAGRAKYITPENVDFGRKLNHATNKRFPINTGTHGCKDVVKISNNHSNSIAATIVMKEVPKRTERIARAIQGHGEKDVDFELLRGVMRLDCGGNVLEGKGRPKKEKIDEKVIKIPVTKGVLDAALAISSSESNSNSSTTVTCPDGTKVSSTCAAHAEADAIAKAVASAKASGVAFYVSGKNVSYQAYILQVAAKAKAFASTAASTTTSTSTSVECGTTPPVVPPKDGTQGPGTGTPGTPGGPGVPGQPGDPNNGEVCIDTTDPNTGDHNSNTQGDIVVGHPDFVGYCVLKV